MTKFRTINSRFSVAGQITESDIVKVRAEGFRAIINNRPDDENGVEFPSQNAGDFAWQNDLNYLYTPTENHVVYRDETVDRFIRSLEGQAGPVLAYCKSGTRCTILWALAASRFHPSELVFNHLMAMGFKEFDILEEDMADQSRRHQGASFPKSAVPEIFRLTVKDENLAEADVRAA